MLPTTFPAGIVLSVLLGLLPLTGSPARGAAQAGGETRAEDHARATGRTQARGEAQVQGPTQGQGPAQVVPPEGPPGRPIDGPRLADGEALLLLTPSRPEVAQGETFRIAIAVLGARAVRSFPVTVRYDAGILELVGVEAGRAWDGGAPPVLLHDTSRPGETIVGVSRLGPAGGTIRGIGELVELRFRARIHGDAKVRLERFGLIGSGNAVQPARARGAVITVR